MCHEAAALQKLLMSHITCSNFKHTRQHTITPSKSPYINYISMSVSHKLYPQTNVTETMLAITPTTFDVALQLECTNMSV